MHDFSDLQSLVGTILEQHHAALKQPKSLTRFKTLLARLGDPQSHLPPVIHVAGTNGKGSVIAFLKAILETAGYRVQSYTSPHLVHINERISLPQGQIKTQEFCHILRKVLAKCQQEPHSFFEIITAAAFVAFADTPADICLLEVGIGGRLDPTNVIEQKIAAVVTRIDYDHTNILGNTLPEIAKEKAAIFQNDAPAFTIAQQQDVMNVLQQNSNGAISVAPPLKDNVSIGLQGYFQRENASLAVHVLKNLPEITMTPKDQILGLKTAVWPGRLQKIAGQNGVDVWLDGAHNPGAAHTIAKNFKYLGPNNLILIFAIARARDPKEFLLPFKGLIKEIYCVALDSFQPMWSPHAIQDIAQAMGLKATACKDIKSALNTLEQRSNSTPLTVLICGSLTLVGEALKSISINPFLRPATASAPSSNPHVP